MADNTGQKWNWRRDHTLQMPRVSGWFALLIELEEHTDAPLEDAFGYFFCTEDNANFAGTESAELEAFSKVGTQIEISDVVAWSGPFRIPDFPYQRPLFVEPDEE